MDAAMPLEPDPFAALTQRFRALDAIQEAQHQRAAKELNGGKAAMARLKKTAEMSTTNGNSSSRTRMCIKAFTESDLERCDSIEEAVARAEEERDLPITQVLDPAEVRARLDAAAAEATKPALTDSAVVE